MKYLIIRWLCGIDNPNKEYVDCDSDSRIFTKLYLVFYYDEDSDANWEDLKDSLEDLKNDIADNLDMEVDEVTDEIVENYCKESFEGSEDSILLLLNLNTMEEIIDECD